MPKMFISVYSSTLIKPGQIQVRSGSHPDYYPDQGVIWVSDTDPVLTLVANLLNKNINQLCFGKDKFSSFMPCFDV